ncbi:U32 family peptidase [Sedimenticola selenatireducens]|uniref:U32 family peptidase n=1 Tax=Sedimenticola selenatireducens TaxID=191960 RepID=UPI002AAAF932|nr:U32 family peptidase [Sedimenticola selenatireducens]
MKIVAPISKAEELEPVLEAGADEVFFGMVPQEWTRQFGISTVSRRLFGNIREYAEMQWIIATAHAAGKQSMLTLNAQHYTEPQMQCLIELARRFAGEGGDALILADPALLMAVAELDLGIRIHLSSIAACRNSESARFFGELGVDRVIFPRYLKLDEIRDIAASLPHMEFETFILNDGCIYEEGVCHTIHLPQQYGGPICMDAYQYSFYRADGQRIDKVTQQALLQNEADYKEWTWYKFSCGFSTSEQGYTFGPCGLCAISRLASDGVTAIKIAGREAPLERKLKSIQLVRSVRDRVTSGATAQAVYDYASNVRARPELCHSGYMCYYPEVLDEVECGQPGLRVALPK